MEKVFWSSFLEGFTGGALFHKLEQPGAATQVFADAVPDSTEDLAIIKRLYEGTHTGGAAAVDENTLAQIPKWVKTNSYNTQGTAPDALAKKTPHGTLK